MDRRRLRPIQGADRNGMAPSASKRGYNDPLPKYAPSIGVMICEIKVKPAYWHARCSSLAGRRGGGGAAVGNQKWRRMDSRSTQFATIQLAEICPTEETRYGDRDEIALLDPLRSRCFLIVPFDAQENFGMSQHLWGSCVYYRMSSVRKTLSGANFIPSPDGMRV